MFLHEHFVVTETALVAEYLILCNRRFGNVILIFYEGDP
jgi:hypothetical protein